MTIKRKCFNGTDCVEKECKRQYQNPRNGKCWLYEQITKLLYGRLNAMDIGQIHRDLEKEVLEGRYR